MSTIVSNLFNKVKQNKLVAESMTIYQIATEVYQTVRKDTEPEKVQPMEKLYLDACVHVTKTTHKEAAQRPDYKAVAFTFKNARKVQEKSKEQVGKLYETSKTLRRNLHNQKESLQTSLSIKFSGASKKLASVQNYTAGLVKVARVELSEKLSAVQARIYDAYDSMMSSDMFIKMSDKIREKVKFARDVFMFTVLTGRDLVYASASWMKDKLASYPIYDTLCTMTSNQLQTLKKGYNYAAGTFMNNEKAALEMFNYNYNAAAHAFDQNKKVAHLFYIENKKSLSTYFKNYEMEVFYSPENSVKVFEFLRILMAVVFARKQDSEENEVIATVSDTAKTSKKHSAEIFA